jgi:hypothetical protein
MAPFQSKRRLPNGSLQHMVRVPRNATTESISAAFAQAGLHVPPENIEVRFTTAVLSISAQTVSDMLNRLMDVTVFQPMLAAERRPTPQDEGPAWPPPGVVTTR